MSRTFPRASANWRTALAGAAALAVATLTGCASDDAGQSGGYQQRSAIQASDTSRSGNPAQSGAAMAYPTGNRETSDLLIEQIGPREARVGQPYSYQVRVTNLRNAPLSGVVLNQRVPDDFRLAGDAARAENGQAQINVGDLGPKESKTVQLTGTPSREGTIDTCLTARYNPPALCSQIAVVAPAVRVAVEGPSQADVCQDIVYQYTVTNAGTGTAHNVVLQANLPEGLSTADGQQRTLSANVGDLGQGQSKNVQARLRAAQPGSFATQAVAHSDAGDAQSQQITTQVNAPRLEVSITGPREEYLGQQPLTYQVTVKNIGQAPASQTRLRLGATPGMVDFMNAEGAQGSKLASAQQGGGQDLGTLAPGESRQVAVNFKPRQGGAVAVDATAEARCAQPVTTSTNSNILTLTASALIVTHDPDPVRVGNNVVYKILVQNKGTAPDHDVRVTAALPQSLQFVRASGDTEAANNGQTITFGAIPVLQPKQTMTWQVEAKALKAEDTQFRANMVSQSTPNAAEKIEPTKLYGVQGGVETRTKQADAPAPVNALPQTPTTRPVSGQPNSDLNK